MDRKRLLEAAKFLNNLKIPPKAKFKMSTFIEHYGKSEHDDPKKDNFCGTAACAMGWLALKGKFGLTISLDVFDNQFEVLSPEGGEGFDAACEIFGITTEGANHLFGGNEKTPPQVAKKILKFVEVGDKLEAARQVLDDFGNDPVYNDSEECDW